MTSEHATRKGRERGDEPGESEQVALCCCRQQFEQFRYTRKSCIVIRWKVIRKWDRRRDRGLVAHD